MKLVTLENGLRVVFEEDKNLRSAKLCVCVASGSRYESSENNGISHFIEHMVFKGTGSLSAYDIASKADEAGAYMNAYTTKEYTCFYITSLGNEISGCADLIFDMLTDPLFDEKDLETEREVILEEIAMYEDDPGDVCFGLLEKAVMPTDPLGTEILGTRQTVSRLTADDLRAHMKKYYVPERTVIGISGNYDEKEILEKINRYFGGWKFTDFPLCNRKVEQSSGYNVLSRQFEQSQLMLAFPAPGSDDPVRFQLQVLVTILGGSSSSRLNQRIREQLGLVYSIDSWYSHSAGAGFIGVGLALTPAREDEALRETCAILRNFPSTITEKELNTAKQKVKSNLLMSRENPHSKLIADAYSLLVRGCFTDDGEIIDSINALTLERARELSAKYISFSRVSFAACGQIKDSSHYKKIIEENI